MTKNVYCSSCKVPDILVRLKLILKFPDLLFKNTGIFHENTRSGSLIVHCGQTDRCNEVNSRFSQFCECA